jgi:hypothetical protein
VNYLVAASIPKSMVTQLVSSLSTTKVLDGPQNNGPKYNFFGIDKDGLF